MTGFQKTLFGVLLSSAIWTINGESSFAGSSVSSDSSGTRSVLVTGRNGVVQTRIGGGPGVAAGPVGPGGSYASAGGATAYAGPGGAYAGPGPWGFPYWNNGYEGPYPYDPYPPPYPYDPYPYGGGYRGGNSVGVYSSSDGNGVQTRFANVAPGGQATIVEQNGNEPPRVYTYHATLKEDTEKAKP